MLHQHTWLEPRPTLLWAVCSKMNLWSRTTKINHSCCWLTVKSNRMRLHVFPRNCSCSQTGPRMGPLVFTQSQVSPALNSRAKSCACYYVLFPLRKVLQSTLQLQVGIVLGKVARGPPGWCYQARSHESHSRKDLFTVELIIMQITPVWPTRAWISTTYEVL